MKKITKCRISDSTDLTTVLSLGDQFLTGVFPKTKEEQVTIGPLDLVWSKSSGLLQLAHSYDSSEMYGDNYGYRSGLNQSMVDHLSRKVNFLEKFIHLRSGDTVLDIGSNDGTTLKSYKNSNLNLIGIDPTGNKFKEFYPDNIKLVSDFFNKENYFSVTSDKARIVTSIAMFYDLDDPIAFAKDIDAIMSDDGIWHFEQSYMPSMMRMNSYDTICHEHLEYYSLHNIVDILEKANLKIVDVLMNNINGGSFAVTAAKKSNNNIQNNTALIKWMLDQEKAMNLDTIKPYNEFKERVFRHREDLTNLINALVNDGKKIVGYGASTKGNVLLQFCNFSTNQISAIAEVNEQKFGCFTPGTHIPIISEKEARLMKPDYFLVLPWHFKESILRREQEYLENGGRFIFPFPEIEII